MNNNWSNKKPLVSRHRKQHDAYQHNAAARLEGVVKNKGIKPVRKPKKKGTNKAKKSSKN